MNRNGLLWEFYTIESQMASYKFADSPAFNCNITTLQIMYGKIFQYQCSKYITHSITLISTTYILPLMVPAAEMDAHMIQGKPGITFTFPASVAPDQRTYPVIHNIAYSLYHYTVQLTSVGKIL